MKKLFAVLMAMIMAFSICVPSFAVEIDNTNTSGNAIATYEATSSFKVTIPTYIAPSEKDETASANMYSVTASDVFIPDGNQLTVTVDYDGILTDRNGVEIPYKLFSGGSEVTNGQKIITKDAGNPDDTATVNFSATVQAEPRYAGTYTDTITFNAAVAEKPYTIEEINANEHMYAIGRTKPEYVIAEFNDDYSEVTIFKNGSDSNGEMKAWAGDSPFTINKETLKNVTINDGVSNIGNCAFKGCNFLANISIPNSVTSMENCVFQDCTSLNNIEIPNRLTRVGGNAFYNCTSLMDITIPDSVAKIGSTAFYGCLSMENIFVSAENKNYCDNNGILLNKDATQLICCPSGKKGSYVIPESVISISEAAFSNCRFLASVTIADSVTSVGASAFSACTSLAEIIIPDRVTNIGNNSFYGCSALVNVTIGNSVTNNSVL